MEQQLQIPSFPIVLSFILFISMVLRLWKKHTQHSVSPPGPWKFPIIGNIPQLTGGLPHQRLRDLATIYGPIMSIQLGQVPSVVISSAGTAKQVLKTHDVHFAARPLLLTAKLVLYDGEDIFFAPYGDHWRQMKKICKSEFLSAKRVESSRSIREEQVSNFVEFLRSKSGSPVNITRTIYALTNTIMLISSVGKTCKNQETVLSVIDGIGEGGAGFIAADVFPSLKFLHYLCGDEQRLQKLHEKADQILEEIVNDHRANKNSEADNLVDILLNLQKNGDLQVPLTDDAIKAAILQMFGAGSDTSSKTIDWAMAELMKNPRTMRKAQEEVREIFGEMGKVEETRIQELKYLKLVVKETLRLHPALPLIPRECTERTKIDGYDIHPRTRVILNVWAIGRDPNTWIEADKFYPERFEDSPVDYKGTDFTLIPFGSGKRLCPGITLGIAIVELFLANLLFHFDWKLPNGITADTLDMTEGLGGTLKRKMDLELIPISNK